MTACLSELASPVEVVNNISDVMAVEPLAYYSGDAMKAHAPDL